MENYWAIFPDFFFNIIIWIPFRKFSILVPPEISMRMCVSISSLHLSHGRPKNGTTISLLKQLPLGKHFETSSWKYLWKMKVMYPNIVSIIWVRKNMSHNLYVVALFRYGWIKIVSILSSKIVSLPSNSMSFFLWLIICLFIFMIIICLACPWYFL